MVWPTPRLAGSTWSSSVPARRIVRSATDLSRTPRPPTDPPTPRAYDPDPEGRFQRTKNGLALLVSECVGHRRGGGRTSSGRHSQTYDTRGASPGASCVKSPTDLGMPRALHYRPLRLRARAVGARLRVRCWRTLTRSLLAHAARALLVHARAARIVMGTPPSALQGHGDGQQQVVIQLPLMRRERLRLQAQQHGAGCRLVAFRHVEQTGGSSVREWMLRLDRMGQARFYGQTTRCAPPLADRYAPAQTVP